MAVAGIKSALHASDGQMGVALLAFGLGAILAMSVSGFVAARLGVGKTCAICGAAFALGLAGPTLAVGLWSLALLLLLLGVINGSLDVVMNARANVIESAWKSPIMSSFHSAWSFGGLLGTAAAGLIAHSRGPQATLAIPAAMVAVLMIPACINGFLSPDTATERRAPFAIPTRDILGLGVIAFLSFLAEGGIEGWTSIYLREVPGIKGGSYADGVVAFALSMAVCRFCGDRVVRRYGQRRVVMAGGLISALAFPVVLVRPTLLSACCALVIVGIGLSNIIPLVFSAAGKRSMVPSQGLAMTATAGYAGFLIGPPMIGTIAQLTSLRMALITLPVAALLMVPMAARFMVTPQLAPQV